MLSAADDGSVASLSPVLTDPRVQSLAGLGDLLIFRTDLATGQTVWTPDLLRRWGYDVENAGPMSAWWLEHTHPDDVAAVAQYLEEAVAGQRAEWELAYRFLRADGSWAWVEGRACIVRNAEGHPVATEGVVRDATRMRAAEDALRKSEEHFRLLTEFSRELVCRHDVDGTYRYISPAITELTQWTPADLLGRNPYDFFHPDDRARIETESHALARRGELEQIGIVFRFRCRDGSYRWLETLTRPIKSDTGEVIGLQTSSRDVTDRRQLEAQLVQSQKLDAIGRLASGVAHEFNNLLTVTSANLDLLLSSIGDPDIRALLSESQAATAGAAVLTRQLMALGGQALPRREVVDVTALVDRLTPMLRRLVGPRVQLHVERTPDLHVIGSQSQVEQLFLNLVSNARDAMPDGGEITVRCGSTHTEYAQPAAVGVIPDGSWVCLCVQDTGPGIPDAVLGRILEPFFTTKMAGTGVGLGLNTVQAILENLGGRLTVDTALGAGTTMQCWLPPAPVDASLESTTTPQPAAHPQSAPRPACRVLVVDDDPAVLKVAHRVLMTLGYEVTAAPGGQDALAAVEQGPPPDIVLTDVTMPEISGPELARRLRQRYPAMPVAFMSGYARDELLHQGQIGVEAPLIHKPFVATDLRAVLDRLCADAASSRLAVST